MLGALAGLACGPLFVRAEPGRPGWRPGPALPIHVQEIYPALHRGRIHVAGGFHAILGQVVGPTDKHHALDLTSGTWSELPALPEALHHPQLVSFENQLYCLGGFTSPSPARIWVMSQRAWRLDDQRNAWVPAANLPFPAAECMAGVLSDGLHLCGGRKPAAPASADWEDHVDTDMHLVLPPGTTAWEETAPLPVARNSGASAVIGDKLHVVGGRTHTRINLADHHVYDPAEERWRTAAPLPQAQAGLAAAAVAGRLYAFGGEAIGENKQVFAQCWVYDPAQDAWSPLPDMPHPRHGLGAVAVGDDIYVIGGAMSVGGKDTSDLVEILAVPQETRN